MSDATIFIIWSVVPAAAFLIYCFGWFCGYREALEDRASEKEPS